MRFVCESCRAQYMINDEKVGPKGVKVRCRKCGYVILVKRADAAKGGGPVAMSNDPDDATATQVMQTPLAPAEATLSNEDNGSDEMMTNPGTGTSSPTLAGADKVDSGPKDSFFGADEDEIGAVFDQVLKGGSNSNKDGTADSASSDDRQSTRVIDADTVRKLAEESSVKEKAPEPKIEEVPQTDWYVAINEKQTGPLTLEKVKEHWDRGEISPDSLAWRAGFDDWIPVSEIKMLTAVLAPKPPKPIVVAPAATITQSAPAVMSVPVQSAFSAGGMVQTVQSEMQVPMSAAASSKPNPEETNSWRPSAANALASLVKDEMDALSKPPPKAPPPPVDDGPRGGGLLDLPQDEKPTNGAVVAPMPVEDRPARPAPPPVNPYLQNPGATYSAPAVTQYRPPNNRNLFIGLAAGGAVLLVVLIGLIVWLGTRQQQVVVQAPPTPVVVAQAPVQPPPTTPAVVAQPPPTTPVVAQPTTPAPTTAPTTPVPAPTTPVVVAVANVPATPTIVTPKGNGGTGVKNTGGGMKTAPTKVDRPDPPAPEPKKTSGGSGGDDDDFGKAFGASSKSTPKEEPKADTGKKTGGYIPPAPGGGGDVKDSLEQSDIMEVVLANKGSLTKCVEEQRKKDPGTSGKLLMKWQIQTSGRTSNVTVASEEFKGTVMATCVGTLIKGMTFPKHKKQGEPITFPFKF